LFLLGVVLLARNRYASLFIIVVWYLPVLELNRTGYDMQRNAMRMCRALISRVIFAIPLITQTTTTFGQDQTKALIAFIGDSMAEEYWDGLMQLVERDSCLKSHLELKRFSKISTGLMRPHYFDWAAEVRRIGARYKPQLFMITIGANDVGYDDKYSTRILAVLESAVATQAGLLWIGLPAMRAIARDRDAREKNKLFEQTITAFGVANVRYVEPWKLRNSDEDKFASYGPDHNGRLVQIRSPDGTHFTSAGGLITASYLLPKIVLALAEGNAFPCARDGVQVR
jgi:uncharacterized protein